MASGKQGYQHVLKQVILANNNPLYFEQDLLHALGKCYHTLLKVGINGWNHKHCLTLQDGYS
jgi:hypothetical protein